MIRLDNRVGSGDLSQGPWHRTRKIKRTCWICTRLFLSKSSSAKYCSNACKCKAVPLETRRFWDRERHKRFYKKNKVSRSALWARKNPEAALRIEYRRNRDWKKYYSDFVKKHGCSISGRWIAKSERNLKLSREYTRNYHQSLRSQVLDHYGRKCTCCGEWREQFLGIDHKNGNGAAHRRETGNGSSFYKWIIAHRFPKYLRVLCHNCNLSRGFYGFCPHEKEREAVA